ncbi:hypothetical protein AX16_009879 [Volvariella volvacea WC 439]|nr:hypothetical protein AX16_009879 [Volvariella volvacea WC 439]
MTTPTTTEMPTTTNYTPLLDLSETPLANYYKGYFIKVLDDVFTQEECQRLISLAETGAKWEQARLHYGLSENDTYVDTDYRNSERILRFDKDAADFMYQRLLPYVRELERIDRQSDWADVVGPKSIMVGVWRLAGINERLSFLRYGPGHFFRKHCDARHELPDGRKSRVTLQVYLNTENLEGGATRIMSKDEKKWVDVEPKAGRVLIFQQKGIWHSGEEVTRGVKYTVRSDFLFTWSQGDEDGTVEGGTLSLPESPATTPAYQSVLQSLMSVFGKRT